MLLFGVLKKFPKKKEKKLLKVWKKKMSEYKTNQKYFKEQKKKVYFGYIDEKKKTLVLFTLNPPVGINKLKTELKDNHDIDPNQIMLRIGEHCGDLTTDNLNYVIAEQISKLKKNEPSFIKIECKND